MHRNKYKTNFFRLETKKDKPYIYFFKYIIVNMIIRQIAIYIYFRNTDLIEINIVKKHKSSKKSELI